MTIRTLGCLAALACVPTALGDVYSDAIGDIAVGNANLDITQVEVTHDADNLYMTVSLNGWEDWTKLLVFMDAGSGSATSGTNNPWGRAISTDWEFNDFYGTYFDDGDFAQDWNYNGSEWGLTISRTVAVDRGAATVMYTFSQTSLGIGEGDTISFDVATTGGNGGDPGIDLASTSTVQPSWGEGTSQSINPLTYTLGGSTPVVPGVGGLVALAGIGFAGRRRSR